MTQRHCGDCRMCCKLLYVGEKGTIDGEPYLFIHKPGTWCKHAILKPGIRGCELHGTPRKPFACTSFRCLWLLGEGREEDRPDKIKVVVSVEPRASGGSAEEVASGPPETYLMVYEGAPGASRSERAQPFLNRVAEIYEEVDAVRGLEIAPFGKPWADRLCNHKDKGQHIIRLHGWPAPVDADAERAEFAEMFWPGAEELSPNELMDAVAMMPEERRAVVEAKLQKRIAMTIESEDA